MINIFHFYLIPIVNIDVNYHLAKHLTNTFSVVLITKINITGISFINEIFLAMQRILTNTLLIESSEEVYCFS